MIENNKLKVYVVHIETDRFFDECERSYLPLMQDIFGVYLSKNTAEKEIFEYFDGDEYVLEQTIPIHTDKGTEYAYIFKYEDKNYGGYCLYTIDIIEETVVLN